MQSIQCFRCKMWAFVVAKKDKNTKYKDKIAVVVFANECQDNGLMRQCNPVRLHGHLHWTMAHCCVCWMHSDALSSDVVCMFNINTYMRTSSPKMVRWSNIVDCMHHPSMGLFLWAQFNYWTQCLNVFNKVYFLFMWLFCCIALNMISQTDCEQGSNKHSNTLLLLLLVCLLVINME